MSEFVEKKQDTKMDLVKNVFSNGLSIIKKGLIAKESQKINDLNDKIWMIYQQDVKNYEKYTASFIKLILSLRQKSWRFALVVPKFID